MRKIWIFINLLRDPINNVYIEKTEYGKLNMIYLKLQEIFCHLDSIHRQ